MRVLYKTDRVLLRQLWPVCAAYTLVGLSFGAIAAAAGVPAYIPIISSLAVFAGSAQFTALGIVLGGGGIVAATLAGLVINVRMVGYSLAVTRAVNGPCWRVLLLSHLITDVNTALALQRKSRRWRRRALWLGGICIFLVWNLSTAAGVLIGARMADMHTFGLDAVLPAILLGLVRPALRDVWTRRACLAGAAIVLVTSAWLPAGVPVILALAGVPIALRPARLDEPARR